MSYQRNTLEISISNQIRQILEDMSGGGEVSPNNTGNIEVQPDGFFPGGAFDFTRRYNKPKKKKKKDDEKMDS